MSKAEEEKVRLRASVIMRVRSGELTARAGAKLLGVSRKTYYELENRALHAMVDAMEAKPHGRPSTAVDEEKEALRRRVAALEHELEIAKKTTEVRDILHAYELQCEKEKRRAERDAKKKRRSGTKL